MSSPPLECPRCHELLAGEECRLCRPPKKRRERDQRSQPDDPTIYEPRYDGLRPFDGDEEIHDLLEAKTRQ